MLGLPSSLPAGLIVRLRIGPWCLELPATGLVRHSHVFGPVADALRVLFGNHSIFGNHSENVGS
jgi:hypothetical protein